MLKIIVTAFAIMVFNISDADAESKDCAEGARVTVTGKIGSHRKWAYHTDRRSVPCNVDMIERKDSDNCPDGSNFKASGTVEIYDDDDVDMVLLDKVATIDCTK